MRRLYYLDNKEDYFDWRIQALNALEPSVMFFCRQEIKGMDYDDLAQEIRLLLWKDLNKYDNKRSSLRTWASVRIRSYLGDITNTRKYKKDLLDSKKRDEYPISYI